MPQGCDAPAMLVSMPDVNFEADDHSSSSGLNLYAYKYKTCTNYKESNCLKGHKVITRKY